MLTQYPTVPTTTSFLITFNVQRSTSDNPLHAPAFSPLTQGKPKGYPIAFRSTQVLWYKEGAFYLHFTLSPSPRRKAYQWCAQGRRTISIPPTRLGDPQMLGGHLAIYTSFCPLIRSDPGSLSMTSSPIHWGRWNDLIAILQTPCFIVTCIACGFQDSALAVLAARVDRDVT